MGCEASCVYEKLKTIIELVGRLTHCEEIYFEVTLGNWNVTGFDVLTDLESNRGELVPTDTTEYANQVTFKLS